MKHSWVIMAVILWVFALAPMHYAEAQISCENAFKRPVAVRATISERVAKNDFITNRDLFDYKNDLHPDFTVALTRLSAESHWIDMGAGKAKAQIDFMKSVSSSSRPYVTAVAFKIDRWFGMPDFNGKLEVHEGIFEHHPTQKWRKADLITDVMGVFSYTTDLTTTLQKSFDLLKVGGEFYISTSSYGTKFKVGEKTMDLEAYLATIPGLKVEGKWGQIKIVKLQENISIPLFELERIRDESPPLRMFKVVE